ncbi:hypothetical protein Oter_3423 [Opitutus terrae PB90-1]|uniref:Phage-Barnase-EndoU-ColicinE5/D-RelE like nuclease 3 domain-containing protein n=2 Tax=Opitutus terrae TaxID=107709 RepID=B1ZV33_OPITP|nr:hypothetical protein Oter_3423 [Opitutus terrae PB90-1]
MPLDEAVQRIESKTPIAAKLSSAEWQEVAVGLSDRAFFSAKVDDIRTVVTMQGNIQEALDLSSRDAGRAFMSRDKFVADMREQLGAKEGDTGRITDITSQRRLNLIYDFQVEDAMEHGRWLIGQDPESLAAAPCQELVRVESREEERNWKQIWQDAGGTLYDGRMIARKDDPIWTKISDFGRPWPPFKYGSGMGVEDIFYDEAIELRVMKPDDVVQPTAKDFNAGLQAKIPDASPAVLEGFKQIFGDQVDVGRDGKITWQGDRIAKLYERAIADPAVKWSLDLGEATGETIAAAQQAGVDLTDAHLHLDADSIRHAHNLHGPTEARADQRPIMARDFKLVPHVWRSPDEVLPGKTPGTLELRKHVAGQVVAVVYDRAAHSPRWGLRTLYVKKEEGGGT